MSKNTKLAKFKALKNKIDTSLKRLTDHSNNNFDVKLNEVDWGDITLLSDYVELLTQITDQAFHEGEHAE